MKYLLALAAILVCLGAGPARAWDGFDADTTDLVEVIPDELPSPGDSIGVRDYDTDTDHSCVVESIRRNRRTVELVVRTPEGKRRTLVMEGR